MFGGVVMGPTTGLDHEDFEHELAKAKKQKAAELVFGQQTVQQAADSLGRNFLSTGDPLFEKAAKFWTNIFALNFAIGVASGIVMEFQFGTNWAAYSRFVGDVFGSALAAEGIFAFFLESGFLAILLFGWDRVGPRMHFLATVMVCLGAHFSAIWIVVANSWQQTPTGHHFVPVVRDGIPLVQDGVRWRSSAGLRRSSTVMCGEPPVVMLITAFVSRLMRGRNLRNTSGSWVGLPVSGSRACSVPSGSCAARSPGSGRMSRRRRRGGGPRRRTPASAAASCILMSRPSDNSRRSLALEASPCDQYSSACE